MASRIFTLFRHPNTGSLIGIPYQMRPGQSPRDLLRAHQEYVPSKPGHYGPAQISLADWVALEGCDVSLPKAQREQVQRFCVARAELIPKGPGEWTDLAEEGIELYL
jgi:hypothetical protein